MEITTFRYFQEKFSMIVSDALSGTDRDTWRNEESLKKTDSSYIYLPAGLLRLPLLALNSMNFLPIYMGSARDQVFQMDGLSYGHALTSQTQPMPTEAGFIKIYKEENAIWTDVEEDMLSIEEILFTFYIARENEWRFSPKIWNPKEQMVIGARNGEMLRYYPESGWEIYKKTQPTTGLKRDFIPIQERC